MKRRLRKKKRIGEFQELGFHVTYTSQNGISVLEGDQLLDAFIEQAIEANGLACGGGGAESMEFFVTRFQARTSATAEDRLAVKMWLESRTDIAAFEIGELRDAWHGHE